MAPAEVIVRLLPLLAVVAACKSVEQPTLLANPTTVLATPTPPPSFVLPTSGTLLRDIPEADWARICDAVAELRPAQTLACGEFVFEIEEVTRTEAIVGCIEGYSTSSTWLDCEATFGELQFLFTWVPTCDGLFTPPAEVASVAECLNDVPTPPPTPTCETLVDMNPADGSNNVFPDSPLSFDFTGIDTSIDVMVNDGAPVAGSGSWSGTTYVWTANLPLSPSQTHSVTVSWCSDTLAATTDFTTSSIGVPVGGGLDGNVYELDLGSSSATFLQPPGLGALLQAQLGDVSLLLDVETATSTMGVQLAVGEGFPPTQDLCEVTIDGSGSFNDPYFDLVGLAIPIEGVQLGPLDLTGGFAPDGDSFVAELSGSIDTRDLVPLLVPAGPDNAVCLLMANFGVTCTACPGGGDFCLDLRVVNVPGNRIFGETVVEVTATDVINNGSCF